MTPIFTIVLTVCAGASASSFWEPAPRQCAYLVNPTLPAYFDVEQTMLNYSAHSDKSQLSELGSTSCIGDASYCMTLWEYRHEPGNDTNAVVLLKGCWMGQELMCAVNGSSSHCVAYEPTHLHRFNRTMYFCCCSQDNCNDDFAFLPELAPPRPLRPAVLHETTPKWMNPVERTEHANSVDTILIVITVLCCVTIFVLLLLFAMSMYKRWRRRVAAVENKLTQGLKMQTTHYGEKTDLGEQALLMDQDLNEQPWIAHVVEPSRIAMLDFVGQGRYGQVYRATLDKEHTVAVKVCASKYLSTFTNEYHMYADNTLQQADIMPKFHGVAEKMKTCDNENDDGTDEMLLEYWLLTEYVSGGSLQSYLKANTIDLNEFCVMGETLASALAFMHTEFDRKGERKPSIAHRDVNSKNVLVRPNGQLILCDLGFATVLDKNACYNSTRSPLLEVGMGTLRYMAPEVLEGAVNLRDPSSALREIDVYAMGLILWELLSRCTQIYALTGNSPATYAPPFAREIPCALPIGLEQMQIYVCRNKVRPVFPPAVRMMHQQLPVLRSIRDLIEDCWDHDAEARIAAECARERLGELNAPPPTAGVRPTINQLYKHLESIPTPSPDQINPAATSVNNDAPSSAQSNTTDSLEDVTVMTERAWMLRQKQHHCDSLSGNTSGHGSMGTTSGSTLPSLPYQAINPCLERNTLKLNLVGSPDSSDSCSLSNQESVSHGAQPVFDKNTRRSAAVSQPQRTSVADSSGSGGDKVDPCSSASLARHLQQQRSGGEAQEKKCNEPTEQLLALLLMRQNTTDSNPLSTTSTPTSATAADNQSSSQQSETSSPRDQSSSHETGSSSCSTSIVPVVPTARLDK